ncbi:hypothetical protein LCGC14_1636710 [marine sediment metagenome]|uniref:Uncharacterized protein n=1 Tax=marine sediment metagenome TaxID=412755 RepID=A0A0F9KGM3_9ZZZZ
MGDLLSWAADQAEDARRNTQEYKDNAKRCAIYNIMMGELYQEKTKKLLVEDLVFITKQKKTLIPEYDNVSKETIIRLRRILDDYC